MTTRLLPLLILALLLAACGAPAPEEIVYETYTSELTNITLVHPDTWRLDENPDTLRIGSNTAVLAENDNENASVITISTAPGAVSVPATLLELVASGTRSLQNQDGVTIVAEPAQRVINGQPAAFITMELAEGEVPQRLHYGVIGGEGQVAFVTAVSDTAVVDSHRPIVDAIIDSIVIPAPPATAPGS